MGAPASFLVICECEAVLLTISSMEDETPFDDDDGESVEVEYIVEEESITEQADEEYDEFEEVSVTDGAAEEVEVQEVGNEIDDAATSLLPPSTGRLVDDRNGINGVARVEKIDGKNTEEPQTSENVQESVGNEVANVVAIVAIGDDGRPRDALAQNSEQRASPNALENEEPNQSDVDPGVATARPPNHQLTETLLPTDPTEQAVMFSVDTSTSVGVRIVSALAPEAHAYSKEIADDPVPAPAPATTRNSTPSENISISPTKPFEWEKPSWTSVKLKSTGKNLKMGEDLQAPITHVPKDNLDDINFEANPLLLRPTKLGFDVRLGENLAKSITHCEKNPRAAVNNVASAQLLKRTEKGETLVKGADLQRPITHIEKDSMDDINFEANPFILKSTTKGTEVRLGGKLERPITFINESNRTNS
jgi:hypothetical protein